MFIIDFLKSLFKKKNQLHEVSNDKKDTDTVPIHYPEEVGNKQEESITKEEKEEINITSESNYIPDISESSNQISSMVTKEEEIDIEIPVEPSFDSVQEETKIDSSEEENNESEQEENTEKVSEIDKTFSEEEIYNIKSILRPIVKSYNYEKKEDFAHYAENPKTIKCFLTAVKDSELLIFRPTQSDTYNNNIALFVRRCILKDFKDRLVAAGILNLDIECVGGKIKIRKKI